MSLPISLLHHLEIDKGYRALADVDENNAYLVDEEQQLEAIWGEEDIERHLELTETYLQRREQLESTWEPVGGPFTSAYHELEQDPEYLVALPPLLELKSMFQRILVKHTLMQCKIVLIADRYVPFGLTRDKLLEVGRAISQYLAPDAQRMKDKPLILFEVLLVNASEHEVDQYAKQWVKSTPGRQRIAVGVSHLETDSAKALVFGWMARAERKRYYRHLLSRLDKSPKEILDYKQNMPVPWGGIILGVITSIVLFLLCLFSLLRFDLDGGLMGLFGFILCPLVGAFVPARMSLFNEGVDKSMLRVFIGFGLFIVLFFGYATWREVFVPSIDSLVGIGISTLMAFFFVRFIGTLYTIES